MNDCIHHLAIGTRGLCPACEEERTADPDAWAEYGRHPEGEANWLRMYGEMRAPAPSGGDDGGSVWDDIPF